MWLSYMYMYIFVPKLLDVTQYCCTLYLTARLLTIVREHFLGPI